MTPLLSVIIPTFNRGDYLYQAAASILEQTFRDFELLIVDDCSTDNTDEIVLELVRVDHRVKGLRTAANSGCNVARNLALNQVNGEFVAFLDDDDIACPERLEESLQVLELFGDAAVVSVGYRFIDGVGTERKWNPISRNYAGRVLAPDELFQLLYCDWAWFPTSTLMFRSSVFERHRYASIRRSDGDSILLLKMAATGISLIALEDTLSFMRRDYTYKYMSQDKVKLMQARRQSLLYLRQWLDEQGISRFSHLHRSAWSNHLIKEAENLGGLRGLGRATQAMMTAPYNRHAIRYFQRRLALKP